MEIPELVMIDEDLFERGKSRRGAWSHAQLKLLGVEIPLKSGWMQRVLGDMVQKNIADKFVAMKDKSRGQQKSIANSTGHSPAVSQGKGLVISFPLSDENVIEIRLRKPVTGDDFEKIMQLIELSKDSLVVQN